MNFQHEILDVNNELVVIEVGQYCIIEDGAKIGKGSSIGHYTIIEKDVTIGDNVKIGSHCEIRKGSRIGDNTRLGSECLVAQDTFIGKDCSIHGAFISTDFRKLHDKERDFCIIEDRVMTGVGVKMIAGSRIGRSSIVGANSTVFGAVPPREIWAGTPAKLIHKHII